MCPFSITSDFVLFFQKHNFRRVDTTTFNDVNRVDLHVWIYLFDSVFQMILYGYYYLFDSVFHVDIIFSNTEAFSYLGKQSDYRAYSSEFVGGHLHSNTLYRICKFGLAR